MRKRNPEAGFIEALFEPWFYAVMGVIIVIAVLCYPFLTSVDQGEIVIKDCDGDLAVWRHPQDDGIRWDGFCTTETYPAIMPAPFKVHVVVDGTPVTLRGRFHFTLPTDDGVMRGLHRAHGSEDGLYAAMTPLAFRALREAAAEPGWHQPKGGIVARKAKEALEYTMKRVSPVGAIWTSPEAKHALAEATQRRLDLYMAGTGLSAAVELGFVTEK